MYDSTTVFSAVSTGVVGGDRLGLTLGGALNLTRIHTLLHHVCFQRFGTAYTVELEVLACVTVVIGMSWRDAAEGAKWASAYVRAITLQTRQKEKGEGEREEEEPPKETPKETPNGLEKFRGHRHSRAVPPRNSAG